MTDSERYVTGSWRYERIDGAGHHLQLEAPDASTRLLLLDFLPLKPLSRVGPGTPPRTEPTPATPPI